MRLEDAVLGSQIFVPRQQLLVHRLLHVIASQDLAEEKVNALRSTLSVGTERTPYQDVEFSIRRVVEIAQRALSPGINDPTTALYCIDRLREAAIRLAGRDIPSRRRHDEEGRMRIVALPVSVQELTAGAFGAVAHYAGADADVLKHLASALDSVIEEARRLPRWKLVELRLSIEQRIQATDQEPGSPGPHCDQSGG